MDHSRTIAMAGTAIDMLVRGLSDIHASRFDHAEHHLRSANNCARKACKEAGLYFVPESRMGALADAVTRLAKRAAKLGQDPAGYVTHGLDLIVWHEDGFKRSRPVVMISLTGSAPVVNGAKLLARIEHTSAGNIVSAAPGIEADPSWHHVDNRCEHCSTKRARIDTFAVETAEGGVKLVGRNCLADFVRSENVADALVLWKFLSLFSSAAGGSDEEWGSCGGGYAGPTPAWFVACAARAIRAVGYRKRDFEGQCTADSASFAAGPRPLFSSPKEWDEAQPEDVDMALAARAMAWITSTTDAVGFIANARIVAELPYLKSRHFGIAAAIAQCYRRELEREALEAEKAARAAARAASRPADAGHFGEIGKRYTFTSLRVMTVRSWVGDYGTTTLVKLVDAEGHRFTWFASGEKRYEAGQIVTGKGTVKKHESSDKYGTETVLSRCALVQVESVAA